MIAFARTFIWMGFVSLAAPSFGAAGALPDTTGEPLPMPSPAVARRAGALIEQLRRGHQGGAEREVALEELRSIGAPAIPLLQAELERRSRDTWPEMIYLLGATGDARVLDVLRKEAQRQSGKPLMDTLYAMSLAGDPLALQLALRSAHVSVVFEPGVGGTALDFIAGVQGSSAVTTLRENLERRTPEARAAAIQALGTLSCESAVEFLLEWTKREDPQDRRAALTALGRIGDPRARPVVAAALQDPNESVRVAALEAAGWLRDQQLASPLAALARQRQPSIAKLYAVWSLGLIGGPVAAQALGETVNLTLDPERPRVLQSLGNARDAAGLATLEREALGPHPHWSGVAVDGLVKLPPSVGRQALLRVCAEASVPESGFLAAVVLTERQEARAIPCIVQRLRLELEHRPGVMAEVDHLLSLLPLFAPNSVAETLDTLAGAIAAPTLQHRLRSTAQLIQLANERGNDAAQWINLLDDGTPLEVDLAIRKLGGLGDPRAVEPLARLFGQIEPERARLIPAALGMIGSERATLFLTQLLTDEIYRVPSLERARSEAARALARYAKSNAAAEALRQAFIDEQGRLFVALLGYARVKGPAATKEIVDLKRMLLARRTPGQVGRNERVNWVLRQLRMGAEIPIDYVNDVVDP
jgi:HEAT repeat protein